MMARASSGIEVAVGPAGSTANDNRAYVDWGAIIAGAVLAAAISFMMLAFGSAIGLSLVSPYRGEGMSMVGFVIATAIWVIWIQASSYMAGGYVTGRLRRRMHDATEHESDIRDGSHGLIVWAVGVLISALIAGAALSGAVRTGGQAVSAVAQGASAAAGAAAEDSGTSRFGYLVDTLFRTNQQQQADPAEIAAARDEIVRILAASAARGEVSAEDRTHISRIVAARTGLPPEEAQQRVNETLARAEAAAKEAADKAKKGAVMLAFLTVASLLVGAVAAWWAAGLGGRHRDQGTDFSRYIRRF